MRDQKMNLRYVSIAGILLASLVVSVDLYQLRAQSQDRKPNPPTFKVDPFWPKSLPAIKDASGALHQWVTGEVGATCVDSHDHIITGNRGFQKNGLVAQDGVTSIPSPPIIIYNPEGDVVASW